MREIAPLRVLALRSVGPPSCQPEVTFGGPPRPSNNDKVKDDNAVGNDNNDTTITENSNSINNMAPPPPTEPTRTSRLLRSLRTTTLLSTQPYTSTTRANASDVDISQPWIMAIHPPRPSAVMGDDNGSMILNNLPMNNNNNNISQEDNSNNNEFLTIENGNHAVETLQLFIDALVESGRAGDDRLGVHFFREWVVAVTGQMVEANDTTNNNRNTNEGKVESAKKKRPKKKQKTSNNNRTNNQYNHLPLGSLSLQNLATASLQTFKSMQHANIGCCLGTLDLTGTHGLTDEILTNILCSGSFPRIRRLSLKNSRKLTGRGIRSLTKLRELRAIDIGGCFNVHTNDVIDMITSHPGTKRGTLTEIYAGGLGWTDVALEALIDVTCDHLRGLGVGFSTYLSGPGLVLSLTRAAGTLDRLSIPFCTGVDDAVASALGKALPKLAVLDIRGCGKVYSLTGMMDGRVAAASSGGDGGEDEEVEVAGHLFVLARYSGISNNSLEETLRLYRNEVGGALLECVLDGGGTGGGVRR